MCVIKTGGVDVILHVYVPESHFVTCSMTKVCSEGPGPDDSGPALILVSVVVNSESVIMVLVPLIHISTTVSTVTRNEITYEYIIMYLYRRHEFNIYNYVSKKY